MRKVAILAVAVWMFGSTSPTLACACCTNIGQRAVYTRKLGPPLRHHVGQLRFAPTAQLYLGEADLDSVKGIADPSEHYDLQVTPADDRFDFGFSDKAGRKGTLSLRLNMISVFEVDPRQDQREGGTGPALYKEWKLTSRFAGAGVFSAGNGPRHFVTLIIHGRGNSCTGPEDFTHWTLVVEGPKANYKFIGDLQQR